MAAPTKQPTQRSHRRAPGPSPFVNRRWNHAPVTVSPPSSLKSLKSDFPPSGLSLPDISSAQKALTAAEPLPVEQLIQHKASQSITLRYLAALLNIETSAPRFAHGTPLPAVVTTLTSYANAVSKEINNFLQCYSISSASTDLCDAYSPFSPPHAPGVLSASHKYSPTAIFLARFDSLSRKDTGLLAVISATLRLLQLAPGIPSMSYKDVAAFEMDNYDEQIFELEHDLDNDPNVDTEDAAETLARLRNIQAQMKDPLPKWFPTFNTPETFRTQKEFAKAAARAQRTLKRMKRPQRPTTKHRWMAWADKTLNMLQNPFSFESGHAFFTEEGEGVTIHAYFPVLISPEHPTSAAFDDFVQNEYDNYGERPFYVSQEQNAISPERLVFLDRFASLWREAALLQERHERIRTCPN